MPPLGVDRVADQVEQPRQRVDRHRAPGVERGLGDDHRERRLARADVAHQPQALAGVEVRVDVAHVAPDLLDDVGGDARDFRHGRALEGHAAVALGDAPLQPAVRSWRSARRGSRSRTPCCVCLVDEEAAAVAQPERARLVSSSRCDRAWYSSVAHGA